MICATCTALESPKVRQCGLCGETLCKETAEVRTIREGSKPWHKDWCCADTFECIKRCAHKVIR